MANRFDKFKSQSQPAGNRFAQFLEPTDSDTQEGRGVTGVVKDLAVSAGAGASSLVNTAGNIYGVATGDYDNPLTRSGTAGREYFNENKSPQLQELESNRTARIEAADGEWNKARVALWETIKSPTLWSSFLAEQAPMLLPVGAAGRVAGAAAGRAVSGRVSREAAEQIAQKAGTAGGVATGAAMHGSESGASAYDELMQLPDELWEGNDELQALMNDGLDYDSAKQALAERYARNAAGQAGAVSVLTNAIPGARILERRLAGGRLTGSRVGNAARGFAGETLQEGAEEGSGAAISNLAVSQVDPDQEITEGLGEAAGMGAAAGPFGAIAGATSPLQNQDGAEPEQAGVDQAEPNSGQSQEQPDLTIRETRKTATADEMASFAQRRRVELEQKEALTEADTAELEFLQDAGTDVAKIATGYNVTLNQPEAVEQPGVEPVQEAPQPQPSVTDVEPQAGEVQVQNAAPDVAPETISTEPVVPEPVPAVSDPEIPTETLTQEPSEAEPVRLEQPKDIETTVLQNRDRSSQKSVNQMLEIASNPDYDRVGFSRLFSDGAPVVEPGADIPENNMGVTDKATTANGRKIDIQYAVVEADQLLPSNRADGTVVPGYQEGMEGLSRAIAGNGRVAGLQRAFEVGTAGQYVESMAADEKLHGIPGDVIRQMKKPVLVRIMPKEQVTANIGDESNTRTTAELSPSEQARTDARRVDANGIQFTDDGEITTESVTKFIMAMPTSEQGNLMDGNQPGKKAYERINNLLFRQAFDSDELLRLQADAVDEEVRNIMSALRLASTRLARLRGTGVYDIRSIVEEAAEVAITAKRNGQSLSSYIQQQDMGRSPETQPILEMMAENIRSAKRIGEHLSSLADLFYNESQRADEDMFGPVEKRSRDQLFGETYGSNTENNQEDTGDTIRPEPDETGDERSESYRGSPGSAEETAPVAASNAEESEFSLTTQTEESAKQSEIEAAEREKSQQKAKQQDQDRAEADAERDDFRLSGSSAPSDIATSYGQNDLLASTRAVSKPIEQAASEVDQSPTDAQKEAGNYKKGHTTIQGLNITIENPKGSTRSGTDPNGNDWSITMQSHYGYIKRTKGADGEHVDVFVGPDTESDQVFVIDQVDQNGSFDEHKVMIGFSNQGEAISNYKSNYQKGWKVGPVTQMTIDDFKTWLRDADNSKPVAKPGSTETPAQRRSRVKSEKAAAAKDRVRNFLGASEGDTIIPSMDIGYSKAGESYVVESISGKGEVRVARADTGSRTQWSPSEIIVAQKAGITFEVVEAAATGNATSAEKSSSYGANNKLVSKDRADELRRRLKDKLKNQLNSGIDPEMLAMGAELAAFHIEAGARKFSDFAKAIADDLGVSPSDLKRYLRSWYNGARDMMEDSDLDVSGMDSPDLVREQLNTITGETNNVERPAADPKQDSQDGQQRSDEANSLNERRGQGGSETDEAGSTTGADERGSSGSLDFGGTTSNRESGNKPVRSEKSRLEADAARDTDSDRSLPSSTGGLFADRESGTDVSQIAAKSPAKKPVKPLSAPKTVTPADLSEIKQQMPFLTAGQAEDVAFAETRFSKPDGFGVLFTNGTGTGKTFSGLGVVKRLVMSGKTNILIATPKQPIVDAWVKAGDGFFDLSIKKLADTKDAGQGIVVTTFANLGDNDAVVNRNWDAIVIDEAHYLSSASDGRDTKALDRVRDLTLKRNTARSRIYAQNRDLVEQMNSLYETAKMQRMSDDQRDWHKADATQKKAGEIHKKLDALVDAERKRIASALDADKPRAIFLSATPFSYEKNVAWANEFLFDWGTDESGGAYNSGNNYERFMMQHFGYRMRYNKLTEPDAKVDRGLMQRAFNSWLRKEGVLSARSLDSEYDYDRLFIYADNPLGKRVDDAIDWIRERSHGDNEVAGMDDLYREMIEDKFDYHARMYFLEAIKAKEAIPQIRQHVKLGRKVLVMHDFNKGGVSNPFRINAFGNNEKAQEMASAYAQFKAEFSDLISAFDYMPSPINQLTAEFPEAVIYNGTVPAKKRIALQDQFNSDASGSPMIMIAQGDAMREGVSIHDTSGKHQRVLLHLGMPVKPTASIQQEGRIYRTGQASNAMFRYLTIGSNWERYAFASKIASRASAAENLAMGEQARGLKESFISAYENAGSFTPGFEGEGTGGKENDMAYASALTPWDTAKSYYFGSKKYQSGRSARGREHSEFFATPEPLGMKMVEWADIRPGESALEPSAGLGAIARWLPEGVEKRAIEYSNDLASRLALHFDGDLMTGDFMDHHIVNKYDAIVMNPPFGAGGKQAADHVAKAIKHLRDHGRIVALIPTGPAADKKFDKLLYDNKDTADVFIVADIALPRVTFERAGTSVSARIIVLEKQADKDMQSKLIPVSRDYSSAESIEEFFDRIEGSEIPARSIPEPEPEEVTAESASGDFETWEAEHSKTGEKLFMAKPTQKLSRENYLEVAQAAKQNGGYWSRFGKPGFLFKSAEARDNFVGQGEGNTTSFSRQSGMPVALSMGQAQSVVNAMNGKLQSAPDVILVNSLDDPRVPDAARADNARQLSRGATGKVEGFHYKGQSFIVLDGVSRREGETDAQALFRVFSHEVLGHGGLRGLFEYDLVNVLDEVIEHRRGDVDRKIKDYGLDGESKADQRQAAEEVLAELAESQPELDIVTRAIEAIRRGLRRLYLIMPKSVQSLLDGTRFVAWVNEMTNTEIIDRFIIPARQYMQSPTQEAWDGSLAFSRNQVADDQTNTPAFKAWFGDSKVVDESGRPLVVYHGSPDARFVHDDGIFKGSNERWGMESNGRDRAFWFAKDRGVAATYADDRRAFDYQNADPEVIPAYLSLKDPLIIDGEGKTWREAQQRGKTSDVIEQAREGGYDGVIIQNVIDDYNSYEGNRTGKATDTYVVFDSAQIKSATDNAGTFDPNNPDIRFSRSAASGPEFAFAAEEVVAESFAAPTETLARVAIRKFQDKFKVLKDLQANIQEAGGTITDENDAYLAEELFHGKAENDLREIQDQYVKPLAKKMASFGISRADLDQYLYAKHAPERNAYIAEINPEMPDGGSGMTDGQAAQILTDVKASGKEGKYEQLAGIVYDMLAIQRDMITEGSLESDGTIEAWRDRYEYYVPLKGWADDTKDQGKPRSGSGFNIRGRESRAALGRTSEAASPLSYTIMDLTEKVIRRRKNEVGNAFLKLVQDNPNQEYWDWFTDEKPDTERRLVKEPDPLTGDNVNRVRRVPVPMAMLSDRYFATKVNGKTFYIKLEDPRLMKALKNLGPESSGTLVSALSSITRVMSAMNTSYSPEFMVSNFARDVQTALLNLQAEQSLGDKGKAAGAEITKQTLKDIPVAMRAIHASLRGKKLKGAAAEWQGFFDQFRQDGAKTGWFDMKDLDGQAKQIDKLISIAEGGVKGGALEFGMGVADLVENANQAVENAVRLAAYTNAVKAGIPRKRAASLAKNMTVNFNRRGELGTMLNALYMFANASTQGVANFARTMGTMKGDGKVKWSNLNNAQKIAVGITSGAFFLAMANRMGTGDDDDGVNWYDKVPTYERERNIVIMKSLLGGPRDGSYWKIPLPYGYNVFYVMGDSTESVVNGAMSATEAAGNLAMSVFGSFSPIGFQDSETVHGVMLKNAAPTVIKPLVEVALNENFMGSSIYTENLPFGVPSPDSSLGRRSTPEAYRNLAQWLNETTGGSEFRSGAIDVNPDIMQHFLDYFGGSAYSFFGSKVPDFVHRLASGAEVEARKTPFVSRITGRVLPYEDTDDFYRRRDEIGQIINEYRSLTSAERLRFPSKDRQKMALNGLMRQTENKLKLFRRQRDAVYGEDLSVAERDRRLKAIESKMKQAIDTFNRAFNAAD